MAGRPKKETKNVAPETIDATTELVKDVKTEIDINNPNYINELDNSDITELTKTDLVNYVTALKNRVANLDNATKSAFEQYRAFQSKYETLVKKTDQQVAFIINNIANVYGTALLVQKDLKGDFYNGN